MIQSNYRCVCAKRHATRPCSLLLGAGAICEWCASAPTRSAARLSMRLMSAWHAMSGCT